MQVKGPLFCLIVGAGQRPKGAYGVKGDGSVSDNGPPDPSHYGAPVFLRESGTVIFCTHN